MRTPSAEDRQQITVHLSPGMKRAAEKRAYEEGRTFSDIVRHALYVYLVPAPAPVSVVDPADLVQW